MRVDPVSRAHPDFMLCIPLENAFTVDLPRLLEVHVQRALPKPMSLMLVRKNASTVALCQVQEGPVLRAHPVDMFLAVDSFRSSLLTPFMLTASGV